jgi:MSHA biogenesis protein MshM
MYTSHFGLTKLPFENVPDPVFFFDEGDYSRVYRRVTGSLIVGRGLMVVTGPVGSGKTTLGQMITSSLSKELTIIWIAEPPINSLDLFLFIAQELGVQPTTSEKVFFLRDIRRALIEINNKGNRCLLMIDESHVMEEDTLRGLLLLNNLEDGSKKLLQILLLGQDEINVKIDRPEMSSFKQRISTLERLGKLNREQIRKYITYRLSVAGGSSALFTETAWEAVVLAAATGGGIPRLINLLCERSLNIAYERDHQQVDLDDVSTVAEEMNIDREVFHYKIALKNMERMESNLPRVEESFTVFNPEIGNVAKKTPESVTRGMPESAARKTAESISRKTPGNAARRSLLAEEPVASVRDDQTEPRVARQTVAEESHHVDLGTNLKEGSLAVPLVFLSLSIITLLSSIYFYCGKHSISDPIACLQDLIGF